MKDALQTTSKPATLYRVVSLLGRGSYMHLMDYWLIMLMVVVVRPILLWSENFSQDKEIKIRLPGNSLVRSDSLSQYINYVLDKKWTCFLFCVQTKDNYLSKTFTDGCTAGAIYPRLPSSSHRLHVKSFQRCTNNGANIWIPLSEIPFGHPTRKCSC